MPAFGANVVSLIFGAIIVVLVGCLSMIERHKPALHSVRNDEELPR
ncbi:putative lipoprotein [Raoultella ornithinolytica 2-156-04_S1_C2]|nr:putative lipoprotein [Raoultella ornithinolytica 2-156-04_S1_C1]KDX16073.1 putative lipoprotein [Raoultella ornithinolytica 2-156-04_S1_C2]